MNITVKSHFTLSQYQQYISGTIYFYAPTDMIAGNFVRDGNKFVFQGAISIEQFLHEDYIVKYETLFSRN